MPENVPVWVIEDKCKACSKCVAVCPAGVLAMRYEPRSTLGSMVEVIEKSSCIGCMECELACPDFAIHVANKEDYKFSKLSEDAKKRALALKANNYKKLDGLGV